MLAFDVVRFNVQMFGMDAVEAAEEVAIDSFTEMFEDAQCEAIEMNEEFDAEAGEAGLAEAEEWAMFGGSMGPDDDEDDGADAYEAAAEAYDDLLANPW